MYQPINGFTKAKILEVIKARPHDGPALIEHTCAYLADDGNKCAVGMFIPEGHRGQRFIGPVTGEEGLLEKYPDLVVHMPLQVQALRAFQHAHDVESRTTDQQVFGGNAKAAMISWVEKNVSDDNPDQTEQSRAAA